ncbi:5-oxoprolinase subunit C family protein [Niallia endozanthoxylica]|uniref:Biotin-dependent carboxyltransferase family protein n=1 Tax=Niallia endozanthoxylica TaxID=2036016 RepID=A0A5J5HZ18_9BACI|nr:biotin-dependent carboxyltransferase family protein [Niallia endozanthoxylica]KAA9028371.1 biotin-dependent carboxyltransferase family protein [Niallia endozanthoxylica]
MITITKPGLLSTIQDLGRFGYQKYGVITSGAMDSLSHRLANILVGNEENKPTIEMTLLGPTMQFQQDSLIAICGGDMNPAIQNRPVRMWRPVLVRKGAQLTFGQAKSGCRAYLAVAGGFSIPTIMNSTSTYIRANVGGFHGRALKTGDQLSFAEKTAQSSLLMKKLHTKGDHQPFIEMEWSVSSNLFPTFEKNPVIRVIDGRHTHLFTKESQECFWTKPFQITPQSDRMGYRLSGEPLHLEEPTEILSEAVTFGTIQVPADGKPIVLMADRQTTGGYPKIGEIASVDLPCLAQAKPSDTIYFSPISLEKAQLLLIEKEKKIKQLKHGINYLGGNQNVHS